MARRRLPLAASCCSLGPGKRENSGTIRVHSRVLVTMLAACVAGCVSGGGDDPRIHYLSFGATQPQGNRVTICHAYTCKVQTPYTFSRADIAEISAIMAKVKRNDSPFEERRGVAYAIAKMETDVGRKLGIKDKAGMQFTASGDASQMDCVDEATNTTSYLLVLKANGLIKHHTVEGTMSKENFGQGLGQAQSGAVLAALDGGAEGEQVRSEICGRFPGCSTTAKTPPWSRSRTGTSRTTSKGGHPLSARGERVPRPICGQYRRIVEDGSCLRVRGLTAFLLVA